MHWKAKRTAQFLLAHLPYGERINHFFQCARGAFAPAAQRRSLLIQAEYMRELNRRHPLEDSVAVEIGPGWQGLGSLLLHLFGVRHLVAFDRQPHFSTELYRRLVRTATTHSAELARASGISEKILHEKLARLAGADPFAGLGLIYKAPGDVAATGLASRSVDLVYSYGVLEHIDRIELEGIALETARILKRTGRACHNIGLHDHFANAGLGNGVNFLRYSQRRWDFWNHNAILNHNRMRLPDYLEIFSRCGLTPVWQEREVRPENVTALKALPVHADFVTYSFDDLVASHLYVDLAPEAAAETGAQT